jgi:hypothetical protein
LKHKEWHQRVLELSSQGLASRSISKITGVPKSTINDYLARFKLESEGHYYDESFVEEKPKTIYTPSFYVDNGKENNESILIISDMHIPYQHENTLDFLNDLRLKYKPTRIICMGDELDKHSLSFHDSDPNLMSAGDELEKALPTIRELKKLFPKMDLLESNHGSLVYRKAKHHGIPRQYLRSYNEVLGVDDNWKWHFDLTVNLPNGQLCYFHHGKSSDVLQLSQSMGMNAVQGHYHEKLGVSYWANPTGLYFGLQTGCLIDDNSLAFSYNNVNLKRPLIGTALIVDSKPIVETMKL